MANLTPHQQAALALDKNISVTAGAGSGKTKILVDRFLKIVDKSPDKVRRILAITFTKKAASEMLERISGEINQKLANCAKEGERQHYLRIRDQISGAVVSTIHGFCARILREFPFEAGLAPDFNEMDEMQSIVLRQRAIDQTFTWLDEKEVSEVNNFGKLFTSISTETIRKMLSHALSLPFEMDKIIEHYAGTHEDMHLQFLEKIWLEKIQPVLTENILRELQHRSSAVLDADNMEEKTPKGLEVCEILQAALNIESQNPDISKFNSALQLISAVTSADNKAYSNLAQLGAKKSWSPTAQGLLKELSEYCADIAAELHRQNAGPVPGAVDRAWYRLMASFLTLYGKCSEYYRLMKEETALVDFEDLQILTQRLLESNTEICHLLAARFDYIMVDEFQDTNILQWRIISKLATENNRLKKDKLFVVGDPKQSIYSFRNADVRIFQDIKKMMSEQAGSKDIKSYKGNIVFPDSFRFLPRLNAFINTIFGHVLSPSGDNEFEVNYHPLRTQRDLAGQGSAQLAVLGDDDSEAEYIAGTIRNMISTEKTCFIWQDGELERKIEYGDIAILIRSRNHLLELEQTLRKHDIPFKTVGGVGFWQRQEIYDFYHLLRFLDNPYDDLAFVGLLRSPFLLLPDTVLFFVSRQNARHWLHKLNTSVDDENLSDEEKGQLANVNELLTKWLNLRNRIPLEDLLHIIMEDTDIRLTLAGELNGEQMVANIDKLIDRVQQFESSGIGGVSSLIQNINELIEQEMREGEALINLDDQETVKVMTIHASKGLQFPVVFVPFLNTSNTRNTQNIHIDPEIGLAVKFNDGGERKHQLLHLLASRKKQKELAEARRLFYVAVTRASNHLYLCAQQNSENPEKDSALAWLKEALQDDEVDIALPGVVEQNGYYLEIVQQSPTANADWKEKITFENFINGLLKGTNDLSEKKNLSPQRQLDVLDMPGAQIFSATRIMTYIKDPEEYYKRYHLGFFESDYESFAQDTYSTDPGMLRGKIVHRFFELLPGSNSSEDLIEQILFEFEIFEEELRGNLTADILAYQAKVTNSEQGRTIIDALEFRNEVSVTMKLDNHFLTGTLDRLYKNKDGLWEILDYKTNRITNGEIDETSKKYLWQIKSYALLLSRLYPDQKFFPVSLYYLHPNQIDKHHFEKGELDSISQEFIKIVEEICKRYPAVK